MSPQDDGDDTPLPPHLPHHVADPTHAARGSEHEPPTDADGSRWTDELPTQQVATLSDSDLARSLPPPPSQPPPPTLPVDLVDFVRDSVPALRDVDTEDELTRPRDLPRGMQQRGPRPLDHGSLFVVLPVEARAAVLARFSRRTVDTGTVIIRQGEVGHALVVVARGRLQVRTERGDAQLVTLGYIRDGEFVGEGSLLARAPSPVQVVATERSELLALLPRDAYELAGAFPAVWAELKDVAERRARDWDARLARR